MQGGEGCGEKSQCDAQVLTYCLRLAMYLNHTYMNKIKLLLIYMPTYLPIYPIPGKPTCN